MRLRPIKRLNLSKIAIVAIAYASTVAFGNNNPVQTIDETLKYKDSEHLFVIHGSNTIGAHLAPELIKGYLAHKKCLQINELISPIENEKTVSCKTSSGKNVSVFVAAHGSGTGYKGLLDGSADIAASSRPAKAKEIAMFDNFNLIDFKYETIAAIDGLPIIVHPKLPIEYLTIELIGKLFSGEINNWQQLNGPDLPVKIYARDDKSGTYDTFAANVLSRGYQLAASAQRFESNEELANTVATTPGAIGFASIATIGNAKVVAIQDDDAQPLTPNLLNIVSEDYALARRLYLYRNNKTNFHAAEFIEFVESDQGQEIVRQSGFASQNIIPIFTEENQTMPKGYQNLSMVAERLSVNFRFMQNDHVLDNKAKRDISRLVEFLQQPENKDRALILVGFSDTQKHGLRARLQAELRVLTVRRELKKYGIEANSMSSYGNLNAVASNQDKNISFKNQRVEVWIK